MCRLVRAPPRFLGRVVLLGLVGLVALASAGPTVVASSLPAPQFLLFRPLDASAPIPYFVAAGGRSTGFRSSDRELAGWALEDWQRASGGAIRFRPAREDDAVVRIDWAEPGGGAYGEMRSIVVNGQHGAAVFIRPDVRALGDDIAARTDRDVLLRDAIVYLTAVHELGHALGLSHTNRYEDVMYFFGFGGDIPAYFDRYRARLRSRQDIRTTSGLSAGDRARLTRLYGG